MGNGIRVLWLLAGLVSVGIGAIGVVLPLLPTTPFLLIAAFAFARSSTRMNRWLRAHRSFGPLIDNWQRDGSIERKAKWIAIFVLLVTLMISWRLGVPFGFFAGQVVVMSAVAVFILTRPLPSSGRRN